MDTKRKQKRRENLYRQNPHCHWCNRKLTLYPKETGGTMPDDFPTLDHLNNKFFGERKKEHFSIVLACPKCNHTRDVEMIKKHYIRQWFKSASFPSKLNFINKLLKWWRKNPQR